MHELLKVAVDQKRAWVTGYSIFRVYCAFKGHFQGTYDINKYGIAVKVAESTYQKRHDRAFFERLSKKLTLHDVTMMFVTNFAANPNVLSFELASADAYDFYLQHYGFIDSFSTHFRSEIQEVYRILNTQEKSLKDLFNTNTTPVILQLVLRNVISIETFLVLNRLVKFIPKFDRDLVDDIVWRDFAVKVAAYDALLDINLDKAKAIFKEVKEEYKTIQ